MTRNAYRYRQRETRAIQRELGVLYTDALRIWAERNPERADEITDSKRRARQDARSRPPQIDLNGYLNAIEGRTLEELGLEPSADLADAYVVEAAPSGSPMKSKLVSFNNTGIALWQVRTMVHLGVVGTPRRPPDPADAHGELRVPEQLARVTLEFAVKGGATVRHMRVW